MEMNRHWKNEKTKPIRQWDLHLMALPAMLCLLLFAYFPMYGIIIAFKDFAMRKGIFASPWVGLKHFYTIVSDIFIHRSLYNTVCMSLLRLLLVFPAPILLALMFNEVRVSWIKKTFQTISYFPYFVSWAVVCTMFPIWADPNTGWMNAFLQRIGVIREPIVFLAEADMFWGITLILEIWKGTGFSAIIYIAAIASIEQEQYEAALIDGASRLQRIRYITLPGIKGTICMLFILQVSGIIGGNFDVSYLLGNSFNQSKSMILSSYTYSMGIMNGRFSYATAIGLLTSVVSMAFLIVSNLAVKKITRTSGLF